MSEEELKEKVEEIAESKQKAEVIETPDDNLTKVQDQLLKMEQANDKLEAEFMRSEQLRAKKMLGGKAQAGEPEQSPQQLADAEATEILKAFQSE